MARSDRLLRAPGRGLLVSLVLASGCSSDLDQESRQLPDISGSWTIQLIGYPAFITQGPHGQCAITPVVLQLTRIEPDRFGDRYQGTHSATQMTCTGVTAAATQLSGLRDTVVYLTGHEVTATVTGQVCNASGCMGPDGTFSVNLSGLALTGKPNATTMSGTFVWRAAGEFERVNGSWTAGPRNR